MRKNICIIGQFPPPVHGLSIALNTLINNKYLSEKYTIKYIDIKNNKKFISNVWKIIRAKADLYYFTISQSIYGNLRDMLILKILLSKNKKVVIHYHGGYFKSLYEQMSSFQKVINKSLISKIDVMIALSSSLKNIFIDVIDKDKIRTCENFIEESTLIDNLALEKKLAHLNDKPKIEVLYLSNFIKSRGYLDILQSAITLKSENIKFHFAGAFFSEEEEKEFLEIIQKNKLKNSVIYHGVVKQDYKKELFMISDVLVLPTYYPNEGQPISIIEAMGNGLAIITTKHAGIPDIVKKNNGYLVDFNSPEEITRNLKYLMNNRDKLLLFATNNRKVILDNFKEIDYINRLEKIFNEVLCL